MKILTLGTCRIAFLSLYHNTDIHQFYSVAADCPKKIMDFQFQKFNHTTKEIIQTIGDISFSDYDVIFIEISTLKIFHKNSKYYLANFVKPEDNIIPYYQTEQEFAKDIATIYSLIDKPIIFIGHINLNFDHIDPKIKKQRDLIDQYIERYCKNFLLTKNIFANKDIHSIIEDEHHYTKTGYSILYEHLANKLNEYGSNIMDW